MALDLRKNPPAPPQPAAGRGLILPPGVRGTLPEPAFVPVRIGPQEEALLQRLGLDPRSGVPGNVAELTRAAMAAEIDELPEQYRNHRLAEPLTVQFDQLDAAAQARIAQQLQQAAAIARAAGEAQVATAGRHYSESIARGLEQMAITVPEAGTAAVQKPESVVDPLTDMAIRPGPAPPSPAPAPAPAPAPEPVAPAHQSPFCPRCGHDQTVPDLVEPEPADLEAFVQYGLGGRRFQKPYRLFGGRVELVLRTLTVEEADLCARQAQADFEAQRAPTYHHASLNLGRYRVALAIARLRLPGQLEWVAPERLDEVPYDRDPAHPRETVVRPLAEHLFANQLAAEPLARAVARAAGEFDQLVAKLEARASDPNFWNGIGPPA